MKFSKLMFICSGFFMMGSAIAAEKIEEGMHMPYIGYEFGSQGVHHISVGHRYQEGSYIVDINGGYKYVDSIYSSFHIGKIGMNIYKSFMKTDAGQLYAGLGGDLVGVKAKDHFGHIQRDHALHPSVSIGRDFNIDEAKKVFVELTYKPYAFGKNDNTSIHSIGMRIGIGF